MRKRDAALLAGLAAACSQAFDANKFRTSCEADSSFCSTLRAPSAAKPPQFEVQAGSVLLDEDGGGVTALLWQQELGPNSTVRLRVSALAHDGRTAGAPPWRVQVLGAAAGNSFRIAPLVMDDPPRRPVTLASDGARHVMRAGGAGLSAAGRASELALDERPFRLSLSVARGGGATGGAPVVTLNGRGLMRFAAHEECAQQPGQPIHWRGHTDTRPHGCTGVGLDAHFPGALEAFGLPERAGPLALRPTLQEVVQRRVAVAADGAAADADEDGDGAEAGGGGGVDTTLRATGEPYRLYNLDIFKYDERTPIGLYGSLPFVLAHGAKGAAGVLWLNAADTYVDLWRTAADQGGGGKGGEGMATHWMSEGGALELLLLPGPAAAQVLQQLGQLTGTPAMPPLWAQGYHQSHWNVRSQQQAAAIDANADRHGFPLDGLWLDIEHTRGKRYFTWDRAAFPSPDDLDAQLRPKGRRLIAIADPHLKADADYPLYQAAADHNWLVRDATGAPFTGECWPGRSGYLDLLQPAAQGYWTQLYEKGGRVDASTPLADGATDKGGADGAEAPDVGAAGTADVGAAGAAGEAGAAGAAGGGAARLVWPEWLHAWNDMNEPSVFDAEELTLPRDALHALAPATPAADGADGADGAPASAVEHRVVHNAYGALQAAATFRGLSRRPGGERPFLLTRAFFVGSQRHGAVWTGDNSATWSHLQLAARMVLALGVAGLPFAGADVGGFFGDPSEELAVRWFQLAAWQPFFRGHAHLEAKRREPWLLPEPSRAYVRAALQERQRLLPYWNTLWWAASSQPEEAGLPLVRPVWLHYGLPPPLAPPPNEDEDGYWHESGAAGGAAGGDAALRELLQLDEQWLLGDALLVRPVTSAGARSVRAYLPQAPVAATPTLWYSLVSGAAVRGGSWLTAAAPMDVTPAWQRGGSIVPRRERVRRSALHAALDPISLHIAPDTLPSPGGPATGGAAGGDGGVAQGGATLGAARGRVFVETGTARNASTESAAHLLAHFAFACSARSGDGAARRVECELTGSPTSGTLAAEVHVESALIRGSQPAPPAAGSAGSPRATARLHVGDGPAVEVEVEATSHGLLLKKMRAPLGRAWRVVLAM